MPNESFIPLTQSSLWDENLFSTEAGGLGEVIINMIRIEASSYLDDVNMTENPMNATIKEEFLIDHPSLEDWKFVFGSEINGQAKLEFGEQIKLTLENFPIGLRVPPKILKRMKKDGRAFKEEDNSKSVDFELTNVRILFVFSKNGEVTFEIEFTDSNTYSSSIGPMMIGETGVIIESETVSFDLDGNGNDPENLKGILIEKGSLYLPEVMSNDEGISIEGLRLGREGVSGQFESVWDPDLSGRPTVDVFGVEGSITSIKLNFFKTKLEEAEIKGELLPSLINIPIDITASIEGNGKFTVDSESMKINTNNLTNLLVEYFGLKGWELLFGSENDLSKVLASFDFEDQTTLKIENIPIRLRLPSEILKKMKLKDGEFLEVENEQDVLEPIEIELAEAAVIFSIDDNGNVIFAIEMDDSEKNQNNLGLVMIAETGVILEMKNVFLNMDGNGDKRPENTPSGWKGIYIEEGSIYIPDVMDDNKIDVTNFAIGTGGVYGQLEATWSLVYDQANHDFSGGMTGNVFGMEGGISSIILNFFETSLSESKLKGSFLLPFFDIPIDITVKTDENDQFKIGSESMETEINTDILKELFEESLGLKDWEFFFGSEMDLLDVPAKLDFEDQTKLTVKNIPIRMKIPSSVLKQMKKFPHDDFEEFKEVRDDEGNLKPVEIELGAINVVVSLDINDGVTFTIVFQEGVKHKLGPVMIAETGVILESENITFNLDGEGKRPENAPANWKGIFIETGTLYIPDVIDDLEGISFKGFGIGTGGVYGRLETAWLLSYDQASHHISGGMTGEVLGMEGGMSSIALEFIQTIPREFEIEASFLLPFFDEPINVIANMSVDGQFMIGLKDTDAKGLYHLEKENILEAEINTLSFEQIDEVWSVILAGDIRPLIGEIDWPGFEVEELIISSEGKVHLDGGWIDVPKKGAFDFYGFQGEVSQVSFGTDEDETGLYNWIGISGSIKLVETLELAGSVKGLKLKWYEESGTTDLELEGVGVGIDLPGILSFDGEVAFLNDDTKQEFTGDISMDIPALGVNMDASLVIGSTENYNYYYIYVDVELATGIMLGPTGLSLYGLSGLFAYNKEPNKASNDDWYAWYLGDEANTPPIPHGVTSTAKWKNTKDALAFGAGMTLGTSTDSGYMVSAKTLFALLLPGPVVLIQGKADFLEERPSHSNKGEEGSFDALAVIDNRAGEILLNMEADYQLGKDGRVLDVHVGAEAFFDYHKANNWHLYLGEKTPKDKRIQAEILNIFSAEAYFMLDPNQLAFGYWQGFDRKWKFGPVKVTASAWSDADLLAAVNPKQFWGRAGLHGELNMSVYGFGFGFYLDAGIEVNTPAPFSILAHLGFGLSLPWPLPDFEVEIDLEWSDDDPLTYPEPLKEVAAGHDLIQNELMLPSESSSEIPVISVDSKPIITFKKPVENDGKINIKDAYPPNPLWQKIEFYADKKEHKKEYEFKFELLDVTLNTKIGEEWVVDPQPLQGVWQAVEDEKKKITPTKLRLMTKNAFHHTRYSSRDALDAFMDNHLNYPCLPEYDKRETCIGFNKEFHEFASGRTWRTLGYRELRLDMINADSFFEAGANSLIVKGESSMFSLLLPESAEYIKLTCQCQDIELALSFYNQDLQPVGSPVTYQMNNEERTIQLSNESVFGSRTQSSEEHIHFIRFTISPINLQKRKGPPLEPIFKLEEICFITSSEFEEEALHESYKKQNQQSNSEWNKEGELLRPYTDYSLVVSTKVTQKNNDTGQNSGEPVDTTYYFRTEGPPGFAPNLYNQNSFKDETDTEKEIPNLLQTLKPYVETTVPYHGQKPFYRAYDTKIEFKSDTSVNLMYHMAKHDLGLYVFDSSGRPARDSSKRILAWNRSWGKVTPTALNETDQKLQHVLEEAHCLDYEQELAITLEGGAEKRILLPREKHTTKLLPIPLFETFDAFDFTGWKIIKEGNKDIPIPNHEHWLVNQEDIDGKTVHYLHQTSNIYSRADGKYDLPAGRGTYCLFDQTASADQRVTVKMASGDDDGIGVMFGYIDNKNYYRYSMDSQRKYRRLIKMTDGKPTVLVEDTFAFEVGRMYTVSIEVYQDKIRVDLDNKEIFNEEEPNFAGGKVALYCWGNNDARFYEVTVEDWDIDIPALYDTEFITSEYVNFYHHLHTFNGRTRTVELSSAGRANAREFEQIWPHPLVLPDRVTVDIVTNGEDHPLGYLLKSPEPLEWDRIDVQVERRDVIADSKIPGKVKLIDLDHVTLATKYELELDFLFRETVNTKDWRIEMGEEIIGYMGKKALKWKNFYVFPEKEYDIGELITIKKTMKKNSHIIKGKINKDSIRDNTSGQQLLHFRIFDETNYIIHEKSFEIESTSRDERDRIPIYRRDLVHKQQKMTVIPSLDSTAAFLKISGSNNLLAEKSYRLHFRFKKKKAELPTYKQAGSTADESVELDISN